MRRTSWVLIGVATFLLLLVLAQVRRPGSTLSKRSGLVSRASSVGSPAEETSSDPYVFFLNGRRFNPRVYSLNGTPGHLQAGDLVEVGPLLTIGEPGEYRFRSAYPASSALLLEREDGSTQLVGVSGHTSYLEDGTPIISDPLADLTEDELNGLWGITLETWTAGTNEELKFINAERLCLTVKPAFNPDFVRDGVALAMPPKLRYLDLRSGSSWDVLSKPLVGLHALRFLKVSGFNPFDCAWLSGCSNLRHLDLRFTRLANAQELAVLGELRHLVLGHGPAVTDIDFVRTMPFLTRLEIAGSLVTDLTPLSGLRRLAWVDASHTPAKNLPDGELPSLRSLNVLSTHIPDGAAAGFKGKHPQCALSRRWDQALYDKISVTTRIIVRANGSYGRTAGQEPTLFEETDPGRISRVIRAIRINEVASSASCLCPGRLAIEFYEDEMLVASLTYHHGRRLRWDDGWPNDGTLTDGSGAFLRHWLDRHGVDGKK